MRRCAVLLAIAVGGALAAAADASAIVRTITVSGTGIVTTVPNQAQFSFGVATDASTAQGAIAANDRRMNAVIAALEKAGLSARELQTAEISLTPNTNQSGTRIVNYSASNQVTATTSSIARSGSIIDAAIGAGANLASGPTLTESDQLRLEREALRAAVDDARARAEAVAQAAGVSLGAVETVTEVSSSTPVQPQFASAAAVPKATPVEAGTLQTEEDVTVTFAIS
jgi:uncharacterized protein YggE